MMLLRGLILSSAAMFIPTVLNAAQADGDASSRVTGDLMVWHPVTLTLAGPHASETGDVNPFTDYRFDVLFRHADSQTEYRVPGYFAADGDAANTSAEQGTAWRAHLTPDKAGKWTWKTSFVRGKHAAVDPGAKAEKLAKWDGLSGEFDIKPTDKTGNDFRAKGRLDYVGKHYLRHAGSGEYFLKAGPDGPETFLAYSDFDNTVTARPEMRVRAWEPHVRDWRTGDPTWKKTKGKGLIGAMNYLSDKGCTGISFLTYNAGGDGDNVWPFVSRKEKLRYDCSKLDQWQIVFDHAQTRGIVMLFELSEQENDDERVGRERKKGDVPYAFDRGELGVERKTYLRELTARFAHLPGLVWNLGEENTHTTDEMRVIAAHIHQIDPYRHPIVVHTFPQDQDDVYGGLLKKPPALQGAALQNHWHVAHERVLKWVEASKAAQHPWIVGSDEQGTPDLGVPPDPGYGGQSGKVADMIIGEYDLNDIRKYTLWGALTAGGYGVEYYFGNKLLQSDKNCEDFRSRDKSWDYCRYALELFQREKLPFWEMANADPLIGNADRANTRYCFAKPGEVYLVYLITGSEAALDLEKNAGTYHVDWYNPRAGGKLLSGSVTSVTGPGRVSLGTPPADPKEDWAILIRRDSGKSK